MNPAAVEYSEKMNAIILGIGARAGNLFITRQLWCSAAVLVSLNSGLGGGLSDDLAIALTAGLGEGLGGSGCLCGALGGGVVALGLFLGNGRPSSSGDTTVLTATRTLHGQFKAAFGATCCRILIKDLERGSPEHFRVCAHRTAEAAKITAGLILQERPATAEKVDWTYLQQKDSLVGAQLKIAAKKIMPWVLDFPK